MGFDIPDAIPSRQSFNMENENIWEHHTVDYYKDTMSYSSEVGKLIAEGSKLYAVKEYDLAASKYADACYSYDKEHGEDNADLLLLYGKALFQSAVLKSEVFGGTKDDGKGEDKKEEKKEEKDDGNFQFHDDAPLAEEEEKEDGPVAAEEDEEDEEEENDGPVAAEEDDEEEEQEEGGYEPEQEESSFEVAWEILDSARALYEKKLEDLESQEGFESIASPYLKSDTEETTNEFIILSKKLSETYDLLGEVSLEAENFPQSALDLESCLNFRLKIYNPENSSLISESHYKLSLALEFCVEDPDLRLKALEQLKLAIDTVKLRNAIETDPKVKKDNSDLIKDLQVRLQELEKDPEEELKLQQMNIIKGILGEATSDDTPASSSSSSAPKIPAVNDLTSIVKKRKAPKSSSNRPKKPKTE